MSNIREIADLLEKASQDRTALRREALKCLRTVENFAEEDGYEARKFRRGYAADLVDARIIALLRKYRDQIREGE